MSDQATPASTDQTRAQSVVDRDLARVLALLEDADVLIERDPELQVAVRLAIFHLLASAPDAGDAAVGARGLTGGVYRGHVFWDSDVYVLPLLAATHPKAARAMLEYRIRRVPAAIRAARSQGRDGARFPWKSAHSGRDVTPSSARDQLGELVPILTGPLEEHIVGDVAWSAAYYIDWTCDQTFTAGPGRELIVQTARWWASRIEQDEHGPGHIRGAIGPDEYHERVDDNAFTNVMARWNLKRAAGTGDGLAGEPERLRWREPADTIVDGYDPETGIYGQFTGFHELEPLVIAHVAPKRPVSADVQLRHERTLAAQIVKQADALMLHYLIPDEVAPIDLDDVGHMTAGGLYLTAMGSVWRTLGFGFAGLRSTGGALALDPVLPPGWDALDLRVRSGDSRVRVRIQPQAVEASADPPRHALNLAGEPVELTRATQTFELLRPSQRRFP